MEPLASILRPTSIEAFIGQSHLLSPGKPLYQVLETGTLHSMVLWGPPGCGKTTLAKLLASQANAYVENLSAVLSGVKDIRHAIEEAKKRLVNSNQQTVLFVDEVHRFNKAQQDAFLPYVESGLVTFIGATTENPSFELNNALLSRVLVYRLNPLDEDSLAKIISRALSSRGFQLDSPTMLIDAACGDARQCLTYLELAFSYAESQETRHITDDILKEVLTAKNRRFDKGGDIFYEQISALHKSIRGSSPDAALYWCTSMLKGGCSPHYILRRILRLASEDIGNADPNALRICLDAWASYDRLGSPEGDLVIAQAVIYLSVAPKSNAVYCAFNQCLEDIERTPLADVPIHLRNAPTKLMKELGYGKAYRYPHDYDDAYVPKENYFPEGVNKQYYKPSPRGLEKKIGDKLNYLKSLDEGAYEH